MRCGGDKMDQSQLDGFASNSEDSSIPCPQGCGDEIPFRNLESHLRFDCSHRHVRCEHCDKYIVFRFGQEHEAECSRWPIDCPNGCPETGNIAREEMDHHLSVCKSEPKCKCKYEYLGCKYVGYGNKIKKHENNIYQHFKMMADGLSLFTLQFDVLEQNAKGDVLLLQNENFALREGVKEVLLQLERMRDENDNLTRRMDSLQLCVQKLRAKRKNKYGGGNEHSMDVRDVIDDAVDGILDRPAAHEDCTSVMKLVQELKAKVDVQDSVIERLLASGQNDGVLLWKINEYERLKAESISGRQMFVTSLPFFTDHYGYRMCVKAFLGGDGEGRGSHLSLFVCIMRGPWDDVLPWPFRRRVTFRLLDRRDVEAAAKNDVKEAFVPNPSLVSFQKPQREANVGSGIAKFVSHVVIEDTGKYLIDDSIFVRVSVATNDERNRRR